MIIRSKAPLRLGLAGGGTDVSPYSDQFGGLVLNATINLFAYCSIEELEGEKLYLNAPDINMALVYPLAKSFPINGVEMYDLCGNVAEWVLDQYDENYFTKRIRDR